MKSCRNEFAMSFAAQHFLLKCSFAVSSRLWDLSTACVLLSRALKYSFPCTKSQLLFSKLWYIFSREMLEVFVLSIGNAWEKTFDLLDPQVQMSITVSLCLYGANCWMFQLWFLHVVLALLITLCDGRCRFELHVTEFGGRPKILVVGLHSAGFHYIRNIVYSFLFP